MTEPAPPQTSAASVRAARWALGVLTLINLFNYLDRYVPAALVESLRRSELHVTDTESGFLMSGFIVVYMLTSPLFGVLGDRGRRPRIVAAGIALWSLATGLAGLARSFAALVVARSAVGVGEAAYVTISPAMLADSFPRGERGRVFAIFNAATPIGAAAGYILGGLVASHYGWRGAVFVAGLPGVAAGGVDVAPARPAARRQRHARGRRGRRRRPTGRKRRRRRPRAPRRPRRGLRRAAEEPAR